MLIYKLDTITKDKKSDITTAYIHIMDNGKIVKAVCLNYDNEENFKKILKEKSAGVELEYAEKQTKTSEIEKILEGI